jgi:hypothetical protein
MYDIEPIGLASLSSNSMSYEDKVLKWKSWAARETQLRALLGHYILDSIIAQNTGGLTCQRHTANPMPIACDAALFNAATVEEWISIAITSPSDQHSFQQYLNELFATAPSLSTCKPSLTQLNSMVVLEALNSLVVEANEIIQSVVGLPSKSSISEALARFYTHTVDSCTATTGEKLGTRLRWHMVSLECSSASSQLCRQLCALYGVDQKLLSHRRFDSAFELRRWSRSDEAKSALWHATAIVDILPQIPLGCITSINIPSTIFAAAIVYCGFLAAACSITGNGATLDAGACMTVVWDRHDLDNQVTGNNHQLGQFRVNRPLKKRNLYYDSKGLSDTLHSLSQTWGIAGAMHEMIEQLLAEIRS